MGGIRQEQEEQEFKPVLPQGPPKEQRPLKEFQKLGRKRYGLVTACEPIIPFETSPQEAATHEGRSHMRKKELS
jgi:hypothetical protein